MSTRVIIAMTFMSTHNQKRKKYIVSEITGCFQITRCYCVSFLKVYYYSDSLCIGDLRNYEKTPYGNGSVQYINDCNELGRLHHQ